MAHTLELYWDFSSPFAYLGSTQAEAVAKRHDATLVWRPMLLGGLFRAIGQADVPLATWSDSKKKYTFEDVPLTSKEFRRIRQLPSGLAAALKYLTYSPASVIDRMLWPVIETAQILKKTYGVSTYVARKLTCNE